MHSREKNMHQYAKTSMHLHVENNHVHLTQNQLYMHLCAAKNK